MKLRTRIAAVLGTLALVLGLGVATSVPASAITVRQDVSFEGNGLYLESTSAIGDLVAFGDPGHGLILTWDYQAEGSAGGDGTFYYLHPHGYDSLCITASTSVHGVIKIETCVGVSWQYWWNPHNSAGYYQLYSAETGFGFLDDPSVSSPASATLTQNCPYASNGCTFLQGA